MRVAVDQSGMTRPGRVFVGRQRELRLLDDATKAAGRGVGCLVLVTGEPGLGKTRLLEVAAEAAAARGATAVWGRAWEGAGAPPLWPWVQVLRGLTETTGEGPAEQVGHDAPAIRRMLGDLGAGIPSELVAPADTDHARFYLYDAIATFLRRSARRGPIAIVLDDLQWADAASLHLLRFLAASLHDTAIVVLAATTEEVEEAERARVIGELRRLGTLVPISPLTPEESAALLDEIVELDEDVRSVVVEACEGNPLFLDETSRLMSARGLAAGGRLQVPAGVRDAIGRRLERLPADTRTLLEAAAVIGREFAMEPARHGAGLSDDAAAAALGAAVDAAIVEDADRVGRYRFAHALIRETIYAELAANTRATLHRRVGEALEPLADAATLAHHFAEAHGPGEAERAAAYAEAAASEAMESLAYEDAARLATLALEALEAAGVEGPRLSLLLALGLAQRRSGDVAGARKTFVRASQQAKAAGDARAMAEAALGYGGVWTQIGSIDPVFVDLLEDAMSALGEDGPLVLRATVHARLAAALYWSDQTQRRVALARRAIELARLSGDKQALARVLHRCHWALWDPDNVDERLRIATETVGLAMETRDRETELEGRMWRISSLLELGEAAAASLEVEAYTRVARRLRQPYYLRYVEQFAVLRATLEGRLDSAERHLNASLELGQEAGDENVLSYYGVQLAAIRREQGRLAELEPMLRAYARTPDVGHAAQAALAQLYAERGESGRAAEHLDRLLADDQALMRRDATWIPLLAIAADVAASIGDAEACRRLRALLEPYSDRVVVVGHGLAIYGVVSMFLGRLDAALGSLDSAVELLTDAADRHDRMGFFLLAARARLALATALAGRGAPGDEDAASAAIESAAGAYERAGLEEAAAGARASAILTASRHDARRRAVAEPVRAVFRRDGDVWVVGTAGSEMRLKDSKGARYVAMLVGHPSHELPAPALAALGEGAAGRRVTPSELVIESVLGEAVLDDQARKSLRRRLDQLNDELAEAESFEDDDRARRVRAEVEALVEQLGAATGLSGRSRRHGSAAERARVNVTRSIRAVISRIAAHDPIVGRHLADCVKTGNWCSYEPDPGRPFRWETGP